MVLLGLARIKEVMAAPFITTTLTGLVRVEEVLVLLLLEVTGQVVRVVMPVVDLVVLGLATQCRVRYSAEEGAVALLVKLGLLEVDPEVLVEEVREEQVFRRVTTQREAQILAVAAVVVGLDHMLGMVLLVDQVQ